MFPPEGCAVLVGCEPVESEGDKAATSRHHCHCHERRVSRSWEYLHVDSKAGIRVLSAQRSTFNCCPLPNSPIILSARKLLASAFMSRSQPIAASSKFQLIIHNALGAYQKRTKNDLLAHPLAPQLQACDSPGAILAILQEQVQGLDQSLTDDRWTKWLDPTVNVLFAFSATLGAGVGLVCSEHVLI